MLLWLRFAKEVIRIVQLSFRYLVQFDLEEEDVWRAVLRWAKHQANVEAPSEDWTEYERESVCKVRNT